MLDSIKQMSLVFNFLKDDVDALGTEFFREGAADPKMAAKLMTTWKKFQPTDFMRDCLGSECAASLQFYISARFGGEHIKGLLFKSAAISVAPLVDNFHQASHLLRLRRDFTDMHVALAWLSACPGHSTRSLLTHSSSD